MMTIIARNAGVDHATVPFWQRCDNTGVGLTVERFDNRFIIIQYCLHKNVHFKSNHRARNIWELFKNYCSCKNILMLSAYILKNIEIGPIYMCVLGYIYNIWKPASAVIARNGADSRFGVANVYWKTIELLK